MRKSVHPLLLILLVTIILVTSFADLTRVPPLWWDEGWTLQVARTWVEHGFYGRLLNGELTAPGLNAAFPTTASVALSMKLLGVGVWQGRLPGVLYMFGALGLMFFLAKRLYSQAVAYATVFVLLFMVYLYPPAYIPILVGRQVLAELPSLCFLLLAYVLLLWALPGSVWRLAPVIVAGGLAMQAKLQTVPFWLLSLLVPALIAAGQRQWPFALKYLMVAVGSWPMWQLWGWLPIMLLGNHTLPAAPLEGLFTVATVIIAPWVRTATLRLAAIYSGPTVVGLFYVGWRMWKDHSTTPMNAANTVRLALGTFVASWYLWYLLLSAGVMRYLFPAVFVGSVYVAVLLEDLTNGFDIAGSLRLILSRAYRSQTPPMSRAAIWKMGLALIIMGALSFYTLISLVRAYTIDASDAPQRVAELLNTRAAPEAVIETYDSELFFFLNRPYHYPPDQTHIDLIRQTFLKEPMSISYDPLEADPDYLVVGPFSRQWQLYDVVLETGVFRKLQSIGEYDIYERVRPNPT
jgi:hypothetical protein